MNIELSIIFGLVAMILFGLELFMTKFALRRIDSLTFSGIRSFFSAITIFFFCLVFSEFKNPKISTWAFLFLFGTLGSFAYLMLVKGIKRGMVSIVTPIANSYPIVTIMLAFWIFKERLELSQYLNITMIILGIILLSFHYKDLLKLKINRLKEGAGYGLITLAGWGIIFTLYKLISLDIGPVQSALMTEIFVFLALLPFLRYRKIMKIDYKGLFNTISIGLIVGFAVISFNIGIAIGYVSIVTPIMSASALIAVVLSVIFLNEKLDVYNIIGILLIVSNIILLSI